jgi:hypothetical protein
MLDFGAATPLPRAPVLKKNPDIVSFPSVLRQRE